MPIVKMDRVTVIGLQSDRTAVIEALMRLGAVHIDLEEDGNRSTAVAGKPEVVRTSTATVRIGGTDIRLDDLPSLMSRLQQVIAACAKLRPIKKPMFSPKRTVTPVQFQTAVDRQTEILEELSHFEAARSHIGEIDSQIVRLQSTEAMLAPWAPLKVDLSFTRSLKTRSYLGTFKTRTDLENFEAALAYEAPESITEVLSEDEAGLHTHVITLRTREGLVLSSLRRMNFAFLPVQDEQATPAELLDRIQAEQSELRLARESESGRMDEIAGKLVDFEMLHDHLQMLFDKHNVLRQMAGTDQTFILEGWVPAKLTRSVEQGLSQQFTVAFDSRPSLPNEKFPILLDNHKLIKPYEVVVEMFNPPLSSEVDPTPVLAPYYFLFFGMMLSDVGYGLILASLCALVLFKFKIKGPSRRTFMMFFQCGLSAMFWGVMFGGYFGDMVTTLTSGRVVIPPVLFDPLTNPTTLMIVSCGFGILHLFTGMATKAYMMFRDGNWQGAVFDVFPWYFLIVGLILALAGIGGPVGGYLAIAGAAAIILFSGRESRNPLLRVGKGLYTLYGATSYLGDILSYTRVLALVLATSVIAMVVNKIGFLGGPSVVGFVVFIFVAILGHTINFALSALSAYIHSSRLQFVEFFGKFYEGGGRLWKPQKMTARYIEIERDIPEQAGKPA